MPTVPARSQRRSIPPSESVDDQCRLSRLPKWLSLFRARDCPLRASRVARAQKDQRFSVPPSSLKEGTYCSTVSTPPKKLFGSYTIYEESFLVRVTLVGLVGEGRPQISRQGVSTPLASLSVIRNQSVPALLQSSGSRIRIVKGTWGPHDD